VDLIGMPRVRHRGSPVGGHSENPGFAGLRSGLGLQRVKPQISGWGSNNVV